MQHVVVGRDEPFVMASPRAVNNSTPMAFTMVRELLPAAAKLKREKSLYSLGFTGKRGFHRSAPRRPGTHM